MSETIGIPTRPEEITAVYLTNVLRKGGVIGGETAVASPTIELVDLGSKEVVICH